MCCDSQKRVTPDMCTVLHTWLRIRFDALAQAYTTLTVPSQYMTRKFSTINFTGDLDSG
jgi:hypothetical protein